MSFHWVFRFRYATAAFASVIILPLISTLAFAQAADDSEEAIEEITVTGTQIKGAKISDALAISVVTAADIEMLGVDSGDELLEFMAEQGQNFFSEAENISGGVNSARGDIGAFNLRNLGTGNTLVLINGRRLVNSAAYQTEAIGGSFIPVNTANSQTLPVFGLERVEVLRDGASAIYGADAVAGVVNYVVKNDFEGLSIRARFSDYDHIPRRDERLTVEWGQNFNGARTNLSVFVDYYQRDRVRSRDEAHWNFADMQYLVPEGSLWEGDGAFRRDSVNSEFGQFDLIGTDVPGLTNGSGIFETYPVGDSRCQWSLNATTCGAVDGQGRFRHNLNENRDIYSALNRTSVFVFLNHEFDNGVQSYSEFTMYRSNTNTIRHRSTRLGAVRRFRLSPQHYYNPFGPCTSPNRLPGLDPADVPCTGVEVEIDNYGWVVPRSVDNDGEVYRILQGFQGTWGDWDWDTAVVWSKAEKEDITHNRISNTFITLALQDPTSAAYDPFSGRDLTNIEQALIDVRRDNETELKLIDFKLSRYDLFEMPAGPVGFLAGIEFREESFIDDRDPRLDGTICDVDPSACFDWDGDGTVDNFVDESGNTFPFISDVMNSSPSSDSRGERDVTSLFVEFQVPVFESLDVQLAARFEDFSDIGNTTVGKIAFGWRPIDQFMLRGSWSEAYRVPNLVTVNEGDVARSNTREDFLCFQADPNESVLDCDYSMQRLAHGSQFLVPEESENTSIGIVIDPIDGLTFTLDFWRIEKENTIGLFGEENHTALDLLIRLEQGAGNCASIQGNPAVIREDPSTLTQEEADLYLAAGLCPAGAVQQVDDLYENLDTRTLEGFDVGIYYGFDTPIGDFDIRYVATFLEKYEQTAGGAAAVLIEAQASGALPPDVPVTGFSDLILQNGNAESKHTLRLSWRNDKWGAALTGVRLDEFFDVRAALDDGTQYVVPSMTTFNASVDYRYDLTNDSDLRIRIGINNLTDERAPLASGRFAYFSDMHRDLGMNWYLDLRFTL